MQNINDMPLEQIFTSPSAYADFSGWHKAAAQLRARGGLVRVDAPGFSPFWAAIHHRDVAHIETHAEQFHNAPFPILVDGEERGGGSPPTKNLVGMDGQEHRIYRSLIADWFGAKRLNDRKAEIDRMAARYVDDFAVGPREIDFAAGVGVSLPLRFIASTLGIPEEDDEKIHHWTTEFFGAQDPELSRGDQKTTLDGVIKEFSSYFTQMAMRLRAQPDPYLASVIANAQVDGGHLPPDLLCAYLILLSAAGHDTVATVLTGGVEAFARFPDQFQKLKENPSLLANAVEEIIRWVTPTKHFMRTAVTDAHINGSRVSAGDWILLSYPSANRDEAVFCEPFSFDIARRDARKHLAFGVGPHFCIGNQLARMQLKAFFAAFIKRVKRLELDGPVQYSAATFVSTFKALPVKFEFE